MSTPTKAAPREPLTRERVLDAALALADASGLDALTMRKIADRLGVEAMSLYHHVANKDAILDGMVDRVFEEIALPAPGIPWRTAMRARALSARAALARHRWAIGVLDSRAQPGPATLRHHEAVLASLRCAGFTVDQTALAFSVLDSYIYGFALQELSLPFDSAETLHEVAEGLMDAFEAEYPYLAELTREHVLKPGYTYSAEFERGLELILEGLEGVRG